MDILKKKHSTYFFSKRVEVFFVSNTAIFSRINKGGMSVERGVFSSKHVIV